MKYLISKITTHENESLKFVEGHNESLSELFYYVFETVCGFELDGKRRCKKGLPVVRRHTPLPNSLEMEKIMDLMKPIFELYVDTLKVSVKFKDDFLNDKNLESNIFGILYEFESYKSRNVREYPATVCKRLHESAVKIRANRNNNIKDKVFTGIGACGMVLIGIGIEHLRNKKK